jgi:predicted site-specific integrase-resolvase
MSALLTPADVAARWHIDVKTLSNWRVAGKGPAFVKIGAGRNGKVLYRQEDIASWEIKHLKEQRT